MKLNPSGSIFIVLILLISKMSVSDCFCQEPGSELTKANHYFENHQLDSALYLYKKFLYSDSSEYSKQPPSTIPERHKCRNAKINLQIGNIYTLKEEYSLAETSYLKALVLAENSELLRAEINQNLGSLYFFKENYEFAILQYQKSWMIYSKYPAGNSAGSKDLLINLGTAFCENEEYDKSLSCFRKADSLLKCEKKIDLCKQAGLNIDIGKLLIKLDSPQQALAHFRFADQLIKNKGKLTTGLILSSNEGMADCFTLLSKNDSAQICLDNCLKMVRSEGTNMNHDSARIYLFMGDVQYRQKVWTKSLSCYQQALDALLSEPLSRNFNESNLSNYKPELLDLYKIFRQMGGTHLQLAQQNGYDTNELSHSLHDFSIAQKICNYISKDFGQGSSRIAFQESTKPILTGIIETSYRLGLIKGNPDYDELFAIADASKNRVLLEDLKENRSLSLAGVPDPLRKKIKELKDDIIFCSRKYLNNDQLSEFPFSGSNQLQEKVIDLKLQLDSLRKTVKSSSQEYSSPEYPQRTNYAPDIRKSLQKDEAIIEYLCSDSLLYLFLIRKEGISMKKTILDAPLKSLVLDYLHLIKITDVENFDQLSKKLYTHLITPVTSMLTGIHHLIIIPDEELSICPFETLIREDTTVFSERKNTFSHYLINDFEVSYHFSAVAWMNDTTNKSNTPSSFRFAGFAPDFSDTVKNQSRMNALPFAVKEVTGIAGLFWNNLTSHLVFLDTSATEKNFRLYAPKNTHIHIATHSVISLQDPLNTALVFSLDRQADENQDKNDGLLHFDEISNLTLDASLVVLGACATGKGKVTRTEGVMALPRGFYLAGATNIIYSLWNIPDHITETFMIEFYTSWLAGNSYYAALRNVKIKMIDNPATSLPYIWAGFNLIGK
jgi:CHAT domain-containing protein/tetratricopeptide (TPR) repeat protein